METKELKIDIPEGYEIDKEKSTFENIVFKLKTELNSSTDMGVYSIKVSDCEIDLLIDEAMDGIHGVSQCPKLSYEDGVLDTILFLTGQSADSPLLKNYIF